MDRCHTGRGPQTRPHIETAEAPGRRIRLQTTRRFRAFVNAPLHEHEMFTRRWPAYDISGPSLVALPRPAEAAASGSAWSDVVIALSDGLGNVGLSRWVTAQIRHPFRMSVHAGTGRYCAVLRQRPHSH